MSIEQVRNILSTGSYKNWKDDNYANFINFLAVLDISLLDVDTRIIAEALLEKDSHLIKVDDTIKLKLPTREEQNKNLPKQKENSIKIAIISTILVLITVVLLLFGFMG